MPRGYRWAIDAGAPRFGPGGEFLGFVGSVIDINDRRSTEEALRRGEEQLRLATEAAEIGLWDLDTTSNTLFWPPRVKAMFGIAPDAPISMDDFYAGLHPEDREITSAAFAAALDPQVRAVYDVEYRTIGREDGVVRWIAAKGRGIFDDRSSCVRVVGTAMDITARKAIEERLRELNETLERRVEEQFAERLKTEEALRQAQKMEAMGQLTGGVAHDFNNLLTIIKSSAEMLLRREIAEDRRRRYVSAIADTVERASKLTGQLLAFARRQALQPEIFDAAERVSAITDMLRTIVGSRIEIVVEVAHQPCWVEGRCQPVQTALVNMAVNARDAMPEHGTLTVRIEKVPAMPAAPGHASAARAFVAVSIGDTGSGIAPEDLPHIFEPFFTTKEVGKGTGLGLSQVFGFAKQSGGDVDVKSKRGHGTPSLSISLRWRESSARRSTPATTFQASAVGVSAFCWWKTTSRSAASRHGLSKISAMKRPGPQTLRTHRPASRGACRSTLSSQTS